MAISQDELDRLKAPFPLKDHSIREGNKVRGGKGIQWFVYADKMAVQNRLDEVFPGEWECSTPVIVPLGNSVSASVGITIRGLTRGDTGEDSNGIEKAKGAATDAFRRAAAKWGVSQYLYEMDFSIYTDAYPDKDWNAKEAAEKAAMAKFTEWYNRKFGSQPTRQNAPQSNATGSNSSAVQETPVTIATQTKSPLDALSGNGHDQPRRMATEATLSRGDVMTAVAKLAANVSYQERGNTINKMFEENAFAACKTNDEAAALVLERLNAHREKKPA